MAEKPEDLGLPHAVVNRIINEALPAQTNVSAEARRVIGKTASVFVLYVTATSATLASKNSRKTMNANDVMAAVAEMDFHQFLDPLQKSLEFFRETQKTKKNSSTAKKTSTSADEPPAKKSATTKATNHEVSKSKPKSKKNSSPSSSSPSPPRKSTPSTSKKSASTNSTPSPKKTSPSSKKTSPTSASTSKKSSPIAVVSISDSSDED